MAACTTSEYRSCDSRGDGYTSDTRFRPYNWPSLSGQLSRALIEKSEGLFTALNGWFRNYSLWEAALCGFAVGVGLRLHVVPVVVRPVFLCVPPALAVFMVISSRPTVVPRLWLTDSLYLGYTQACLLSLRRWWMRL